MSILLTSCRRMAVLSRHTIQMQRQFSRLPLPRRPVFKLMGRLLVFSAPITLKAESVSFQGNGQIIRHPDSVDFHPSLLNEMVDFLKSVWSTLCTALRALQLTVIFTPFLLVAPFALWSESVQPLCFKLLVKTLEYSGPVCIKLGQWASTRRDLFPLRLCQELSHLQRKSSPHTWQDTKRILVSVFGTDYGQTIFKSFAEEPVGSGCCAQVHKATLNSGQEVAVKILHPSIKEKFERDLAVMSSFVGVLHWFLPNLKYLSLEESLIEFSSLMNGQLNLIREAQHLERFHDNFEEHKNIVFPKPLMELCRDNVIVESFEPGQHIGDYLESQEFATDLASRKQVADLGIQMLLKMVFVDNLVHGDLHPGNILIRDSDNGPSLVVLDPGIVSSLSPRDKQNFFSVFTAVVKGQGRIVGELFLEHSKHKCTDREAFITEMESIVMEARGQQLSLAKMDVSKLLTKVFNTLLTHRVKLEANYASVILAIMVLEGLGRTLDPDVDILTKAVPYLLKRS